METNNTMEEGIDRSMSGADPSEMTTTAASAKPSGSIERWSPDAAEDVTSGCSGEQGVKNKNVYQYRFRLFKWTSTCSRK
jgi:hypothetical protein